MNFFFFNLMEDWRQFWKRLMGGVRVTGEARRLYVGNLSYSAKEDDLKSLFSGCGKVVDVHLIRDRFTRKPKGYAFVEIVKDDVSKALALSGSDFMGRKLVVSEAKSKGPAGGGGQGGRRGRPEARGRFSRRRQKGPRQYRPGPTQTPPAAPNGGTPPIERLE